MYTYICMYIYIYVYIYIYIYDKYVMYNYDIKCNIEFLYDKKV